MHFIINILHDRRRYKMFVEQILFSADKEQFKVHGRTTDIILESNRPLFRNKALKHRKPNWKKISGEMNNMSLLEVIIEAVQIHLEPPIKGI